MQLYHDLCSLVENSEKKTFFFKDFTVSHPYHDNEETIYRIFSYRLASYSEFLAPGAMESRGIMFEINTEGEFVRVASRPMQKFFNVDENPLSSDCNFSSPQQIMLKEDGSLISTYLHANHTEVPDYYEVRLKSKTSLFSTQAVDAMAHMKTLPDLEDLIDYLVGFYTRTKSHRTVNMEYTAPDNRIVIDHKEPRLVILNVRDNVSGEYITKPELMQGMIKDRSGYLVPVLEQYWVREFPDLGSHEINQVNYVDMKDVKGIEGYVIQLDDGRHVKTKCDWYRHLHHNKDSVNIPRRLFEAVVDETTDDLRGLFHDDSCVLQKIEEMEEYVEALYNPMVDRVETFYDVNKHLDRKSFAIKGQDELVRGEFGLVMTLYTGKDVDFKDYMKRQWKVLGLSDTPGIKEE